MRLYTRRVKLGQNYRIGKNVYKCVLYSPKGINFLNEKSNRMRFRRAMYTKGWAGKPIPRIQTHFEITSPFVDHILDIKQDD